MTDCIFCKIVKGEIPNMTVFENERVLAFMDINPISTGHTLIIPKAHAENLYELNEDDLTQVILASQKVAAAIRHSLAPAGIAILQLNGKGVNQEVMHYHMHVVPRGTEEKPLPITSWELKPGDMDTIQKTAEAIKAAL